MTSSNSSSSTQRQSVLLYYLLEWIWNRHIPWFRADRLLNYTCTRRITARCKCLLYVFIEPELPTSLWWRGVVLLQISGVPSRWSTTNGSLVHMTRNGELSSRWSWCALVSFWFRCRDGLLLLAISIGPLHFIGQILGQVLDVRGLINISNMSISLQWFLCCEESKIWSIARMHIVTLS